MARLLVASVGLIAEPLGAQFIRVPPVSTVAGLPSPSATLKGRIRAVTDGASATSCTSGGGSFVVICMDSGSAWEWVGIGGGGAQNLFETISVLSGTNPVADSPTDTLSLAVIAPLTASGNSGTDTVTLEVGAASESLSGVVELAISAETTAGLAVQASDTRLSDSRAPNGSAGGDLSGSYPGPSVVDDSHAHTGSSISSLDAGDIATGTFPPSQIGTGTPAAGKYVDGAIGAWTALPADDDIPEAGDFGALTLTGDVTSSGLATAIGADKILESMLKAVDAPADEECLTSESTTGDFEWQACGGVTVPGSDTQVIFNDGGSLGADSGLVFSKATDLLTMAGKLRLPQQNSIANPTLSFGDGDTGIYELSDDRMVIVRNGASTWIALDFDSDTDLKLYNAMNNVTFTVNNPNGARLNYQSSATVPAFIPKPSDGSTGVGSGGSGQLALIASSTEAMRLTSSQVTFNVAPRFPLFASPPVTCGTAGSEAVWYYDTSHALCVCGTSTWTNLTPLDGGSCS